ncbi:TPA: GNAT family N-acetyltransferase [Escherichia coli]
MTLKCQLISDEKELHHCAKFFTDHVTDDYITHDEILRGRAESIDRWSENLYEILLRDLRLCVEKNAPLFSFILSGTIVGIAVFDRPDCEHNNALILNDLIIHKHFRGSGLGKKVMSELLKILSNTHYEYIFLDVCAGNNKGRAFFSRNGGVHIASTYVIHLKNNKSPVPADSARP